MGESELIHRWQKTLTDRAAEQRFPCILSLSLVEGTRANPSDNRRHLSAVSNVWVAKVIGTGGIGVISTLDENVACWGANWCEALRIIIYACLVGVGAWRSRLSETVISLAFPIIALTFHEDGWSQICRHETRKLLRFASKMIMCIERLYGPCAAWSVELCVCVRLPSICYLVLWFPHTHTRTHHGSEQGPLADWRFSKYISRTIVYGPEVNSRVAKHCCYAYGGSRLRPGLLPKA